MHDCQLTGHGRQGCQNAQAPTQSRDAIARSRDPRRDSAERCPPSSSFSVRQKRKGHGVQRPWPFSSVSHGLACPWHPASYYTADAPGRPGSARRISPSDSTSVVVVIGREYRQCDVDRQALANSSSPPLSSSRPLPQCVGADDETLHGADVIAHRVLGGVLVALADRLEHTPVILV